MLVAVAMVLVVSLVLNMPRPMDLSVDEHAHVHAFASMMSAEPVDEPVTSQVPSAEAKSLRCGPSTGDCCAMALCHPGLPPETVGLLVRSSDGVGTAMVSKGAIGSETDVDVPPPRILRV